MKKMKWMSKKIAAMTMATLLGVGMFSTTAFAYVDEAEMAEEETEICTEPEKIEEPTEEIIAYGNFRIDRIKTRNEYFEGRDYEDIDFLEPRFIRDERARINKKFRKMIAEKGYNENEVLANLIPLLNELKEEMKMKYDL